MVLMDESLKHAYNFSFPNGANFLKLQTLHLLEHNVTLLDQKEHKQLKESSQLALISRIVEHGL